MKGRSEAEPLPPIRAELIAAAGAVLLCLALFFLKWFGVGGVAGRFASQATATGAEGGWTALTLLRWVMLLAVAVAVLPPLVRIGGRWLGRPRRLHIAVAALGTVTALLLAYRVLVDLPDPNRVVDQKAGAVLALIGAVAIAIGGLEGARSDAAPRGRARPARGSRGSRGSRGDRRLEREIARINA